MIKKKHTYFIVYTTRVQQKHQMIKKDFEEPDENITCLILKPYLIKYDREIDLGWNLNPSNML